MSKSYLYYPNETPCVPFVGSNLLADPDFSSGATGPLNAGVPFSSDGWYAGGAGYQGRNLQADSSKVTTQDVPFSYFGGSVDQIAFPGDAANNAAATSSLLWSNGTDPNGAPWTIMEGDFTVTPNTDYQFSFYTSSGTSPTFADQSVLMTTWSLEFNGANVSGSVTETNDSAAGGDAWYRREFVWNSGSSTTLKIELINEEAGGYGNDLMVTALDLHEFDDCGTSPLQASVSPSSAAVPVGDTATFTGAHTGGTAPYTASWQESSDGGATWSTIPGETGTTLDVTGI